MAPAPEMSTGMQVPFLDYRRCNQPHFDEEMAAMRRVLESGRYVLGDEVESFECDYAAWVGARHAVGVASGLDALILILEAYKEMGAMAPGDEVLVPANTYIASILAITRAGLEPVLVEPDPDTCEIDPALIEGALTATDPRGHGGSPLRAVRGHGGHPRHRPPARAEGDRRCGPGARGDLRPGQGRAFGRCRRPQLLSRQEPRRHRRWRGGDDRRRRPGGDCPRPAQLRVAR
jgi:hypothetical protein